MKIQHIYHYEVLKEEILLRHQFDLCYNSNFGADSTSGADSSLESAPVPALFFIRIGGSDSDLKTESQQL